MTAYLFPLLSFNGDCREAMEFYHQIFGGELDIKTFREANINDRPEIADKIIHSQLTADDIKFMASDAMSEDGNPNYKVTFGDNISLCLVGSDEAKLRSYFDQLSEGGKVVSPLKKEFWGDIFGVLIDKFGINWMVNIGPETT